MLQSFQVSQLFFLLTSLELPVDKWLLKRVLCLPEFDENLPEHKKRQWPGGIANTQGAMAIPVMEFQVRGCKIQ